MSMNDAQKRRAFERRPIQRSDDPVERFIGGLAPHIDPALRWLKTCAELMKTRAIEVLAQPLRMRRR